MLSVKWRYEYDPGQAENQCLQAEHVFYLHSQASDTNRHLSPSSYNIWTFRHFLTSAHTLFAARLILPLWCSLAPPHTLCSFFVCGSADRFSVHLPRWSPLWLPRPSHLSLTSPPHLSTHSPKSIWLAATPELAVALIIATMHCSIIMTGSRVGYSVCMSVCTRVRVFLFVPEWQYLCHYNPHTHQMLLHEVFVHLSSWAAPWLCARTLRVCDGWWWRYLILEGFHQYEKLFPSF